MKSNTEKHKGDTKEEPSGVKYISMDGHLEVACATGSYSEKRTTKLAQYFYSEKYDQDDDDLIEYAIGALASRPKFIDDLGLEWRIAYIKYIYNSIPEISIKRLSEESSMEIIQNMIRKNDNAIFVARLHISIKLLSMILFGGVLYREFFLTQVVGIVKQSMDSMTNGSVANNLHNFCKVFDDKRFILHLGKKYFNGLMLKFSPPEKCYFTYRTLDLSNTMEHHESKIIILKNYPFYTRLGYVIDDDLPAAGAPSYESNLYLPSQTLIFKCSPYKPSDKLSRFHFNDESFREFYVPFDWCYAIHDFSDGGLRNYQLPTHKFNEYSNDCFNISIHKPYINGEFDSCLRIAAECFAFQKRAVKTSFGEKTISEDDLLDFIAAKKNTKKMLQVRNFVARTTNSPCIYNISRIDQLDCIEKIKNPSGYNIYTCDGCANNKTLIVKFNDTGDCDLLVIDNELLSIFEKNISTSYFKYHGDKESYLWLILSTGIFYTNFQMRGKANNIIEILIEQKVTNRRLV